MFWNKKNKQTSELYVHFDSEDARMAYRVAPSDEGRMVLVIGSQRMLIENVSASGIAFYLDEGIELDVIDETDFHGVLYIGHRHNPVPLAMSMVARTGKLVRCQITHQDLLAQKKLTAAIVAFQKKQIRAQSHLQQGATEKT